MEVSGEMLDGSLIGKNKRENEKKEVETMSIETILKKSAITGNKKWGIIIVLSRERFLFKMGDITPCLYAYMNDLLERAIFVVQERKGRAA